MFNHIPGAEKRIEEALDEAIKTIKSEADAYGYMLTSHPSLGPERFIAMCAQSPDKHYAVMCFFKNRIFSGYA